MTINNDLNNNISKDPLCLSESNEQHFILRPTKCPTQNCNECRYQYIDTLGLNIYVICKCDCHKITNYGRNQND
jgi:hypothetical protein